MLEHVATQTQLVRLAGQQHGHGTGCLNERSMKVCRSSHSTTISLQR